ncbi:hypothetical protein ACVWZZ_001026 [Bradyrhizobium sp. LM6.10]
MALAASVILPHTSATRRGIVGGVIFAGVGLGVAASGSLVAAAPAGFAAELVWAWCALVCTHASELVELAC